MAKSKRVKRYPFRVWYKEDENMECRRVDAKDIEEAILKIPKKHQGQIERIVDLSDGEVYKPPFK